MKYFIAVILLFSCFMQGAFASILTSALATGSGQKGISLSYLQNGNYSEQNEAKSLQTGLLAYFGLTDSLDLYLSCSTARSANLLVPNTPLAAENTINTLSFVFKYTLISEIDRAPLSLAVATGSGSFASKTSFTHPLIGHQEIIANGSQSGLALIVSKLLIPFIPYAGVVYLSTGGNIKFSQVNYSLGTTVTFSKNNGLSFEYCQQEITPDGSKSYSSGQVAAALYYTFPAPQKPVAIITSKEVCAPEPSSGLEALTIKIEQLQTKITELLDQNKLLIEEIKFLKATNSIYKSRLEFLIKKTLNKPAIISRPAVKKRKIIREQNAVPR